MMKIIIIFALLSIIILSGCNTQPSCEEISMNNLVKADCDTLMENYQCCKDKVITIWEDGNCESKYMPLITNKCS